MGEGGREGGRREGSDYQVAGLFTDDVTRARWVYRVSFVSGEGGEGLRPFVCLLVRIGDSVFV